jgi:hypothetical protein
LYNLKISKLYLVYDKYLASLGYRLISVKNFMIFYIIEPQPNPKGEGSPLEDDDDNKDIKIIRFLYSKRDWINILKETSLDEIV